MSSSACTMSYVIFIIILLIFVSSQLMTKRMTRLLCSFFCWWWYSQWNCQQHESLWGVEKKAPKPIDDDDYERQKTSSSITVKLFTHIPGWAWTVINKRNMQNVVFISLGECGEQEKTIYDVPVMVNKNEGERGKKNHHVVWQKLPFERTKLG